MTDRSGAGPEEGGGGETHLDGGATRSLVAAATADPLDVRTFSGLSAHLFSAVVDHGIDVVPVATRRLRATDILDGAFGTGALRLRTRRDRPRVRPDWYWSRRGHERFSRRFDAELDRIGEPRPVLQVGTHVRPSRPGWTPYCITDATVAQAIESGRFSVSQASPAVMAEALQVQRDVLAQCPKVFVLSHWAARSVVADLGVPADRVVVTGAGANLRQPARRAADPDHPYVLFVGLEWESKGGPLLLEAFRIARSRDPRVRLRVVGCSPALAEPGVDVIGFLDKSTPAGRQRLVDMYAGASCFCLLSEVDAFPNVLLEAGLMGVPVVSTAEGSRPEVVVDGVTGLLVGERSPEAVADALGRLIGDPDRVEAMGRAAAERVRAHYTWPTVSARILAAMGLSAGDPEAQAGAASRVVDVLRPSRSSSWDRRGSSSST